MTSAEPSPRSGGLLPQSGGWFRTADGQRVAPAWALSVVFHAVLLVVLGLTLNLTPRGLPSEIGREVGVVLKRTTGTGETLYESPNSLDLTTTSTTDSTLQNITSSDIFGQQSPVDISAALPAGLELPGAGAAPGSESAMGAVGMTSGPRAQTAITGGKARTQIYGVEAEGSKFVYVFDRSASTGGGSGSPLAASKRQLLASLDDLDSTHQFQIIFYNHSPSVFNPDGLGARLFFANEANKRRALAFIGGIIADGGTEHEQPLLMALGMQPDVIFFFTDADHPALSSAQLERIRRSNRGTSIHAIEFGIGPQTGGENFLMRLARENNGKYAYFDITRIR